MHKYRPCGCRRYHHGQNVGESEASRRSCHRQDQALPPTDASASPSRGQSLGKRESSFMDSSATSPFDPFSRSSLCSAEGEERRKSKLRRLQHLSPFVAFAATAPSPKPPPPPPPLPPLLPLPPVVAAAPMHRALYPPALTRCEAVVEEGAGGRGRGCHETS